MTLAETQRLKRYTEIQILTLLRDLADTSGMTVDGVIVHSVDRTSPSGPRPPVLIRVEVGLRLN